MFIENQQKVFGFKGLWGSVERNIILYFNISNVLLSL